ncbi:MAG: AAA family ATPase [Hyphomicrobium sp.]|jgi:predicted ATPase
MPITQIAVSGYRSVQSCRFPIAPLTVLVGKNGVGKTNLYRALRLLSSAADGCTTLRVAEEGGLQSALWAGTDKKTASTSISLAATFEDFEYRIEIGSPGNDEPALKSEPQTLGEQLAYRTKGAGILLLDRTQSDVTLRDVDGLLCDFPGTLLPSETALSTFRDVARFPALEQIRRELAALRFYHHFETGPDAPIRNGALAIATPTLSEDAHDLAAVLATLYYIKKNTAVISQAVSEAFPGAALTLDVEGGRANFALKFPGQRRPFAAHELSDGTLRYLCLVGALCGYRLPGMICLNEPESSLHPDLLPALAGLIARASRRTRVWVVTHSEDLGTELERLTGVRTSSVTVRDGATTISAFRKTAVAR